MDPLHINIIGVSTFALQLLSVFLHQIWIFLRSDIMAFALLDLLVFGTYLALCEYLLLFGTRSNEKENSNDL